jgi:hypothetical protein
MIKQFTVDAVRHNESFYLLRTLTGDEPVTLHRDTPQGAEVFPVEEYELARMDDGRIMICFRDAFRHTLKLNLIATQGEHSEVVNLQLFERVEPLYRLPVTNADGIFILCMSKVIELPQQDWRCDASFYGARLFDDEGTDETPLITDITRLITYEPIWNFNGVAHLLFIHMSDDADLVEFTVNGMVAPTGARTLSEAFRLIWEWSQLSKPPFSSDQLPAVRAAQLLDSIVLSDALAEQIAESQSPMQVSNFFAGSTDARRRPSHVEPITEDLATLIKHTMSFMTLSELVAANPGVADLDAVLDAEKEMFAEQERRMVARFIGEPDAIAMDTYDEFIAHLDSLHERHASLVSFIKVKLKAWSVKKELLARLSAGSAGPSSTSENV